MGMSINWFSSDLELEVASHQSKIEITAALLVFWYIFAIINIIFLFSQDEFIVIFLIYPFLE